MGLYAKKKNASGAFSPEQQTFLDAFDGSSDDDDILSPDQRELAKVSVDMTLAGPRLDTPPLLESDSDSVASDDEGTSYTVEAPSGKLGLLFEKIEQGDLGHVVAYVRDDSVLLGQVARGDAICKVDATATLAMDHDAVRALITSRSGSERTLSVRKGAFKRGQDSWVLNA